MFMLQTFMNFRSVSITHESIKDRGRLYVSPPLLAVCLEQFSLEHLHVMSSHTVLQNHSSHAVLQFLLTGWHLVTSCWNSCGTLSSCCFSDYCSLRAFILDVPFLFLYRESKAAASHMHFAGLLSLLPRVIISQGTHH